MLLWMMVIEKWWQIIFNKNTYGKTKLIWSGLCTSSLRPRHRQAAQHFDKRFIRKQSESFLRQPEQTIWISTHRTFSSQYLHLVVFLWKQYKSLASYKDFCKLQFLFMFFFTHTNTVFLFKHLPTEIVIFKNVSVSVMIDFLFFRSRFC